MRWLRFFKSALAFRWIENDLWISATALAIGATLVSRDSDFRAIEGLDLVEL
jgi:predicted nucleic acid-binding protein